MYSQCEFDNDVYEVKKMSLKGVQCNKIMSRTFLSHVDLAIETMSLTIRG